MLNQNLYNVELVSLSFFNVNMASKKTVDIENDIKSLFLDQIFIVIHHVCVFMDEEPIEPFINAFD